MFNIPSRWKDCTVSEVLGYLTDAGMGANFKVLPCDEVSKRTLDAKVQFWNALPGAGDTPDIFLLIDPAISDTVLLQAISSTIRRNKWASGYALYQAVRFGNVGVVWKDSAFRDLVASVFPDDEHDAPQVKFFDASSPQDMQIFDSPL